MLGWHDLRLMQYPASVAVTWETTLAQLTGPERQLLDVLSWLAPEPIPLFLFDVRALREGIPDPREALAGLVGYSLVRFDAVGEAVLVHRLVQEITRGHVLDADRSPRCKSLWWLWMPSPQMTSRMSAHGRSGRPWRRMWRRSARSPTPRGWPSRRPG